MRAGVDGQKASRSGGFGTEYADGVLVVDQVVDNQSVGIVPFHQWIDKSCVAVVADGIGDKLADGYGKSAIGPVSGPGTVLVDDGAVPVIENVPVLVVVLVLTIPVAIFAMWLAMRTMKKQTRMLK